MLKDEHQRQQAIDPRFSFIVQAPAGSGKTELLTQRYLRLLDHVTEPEQIVALTFTRKAANEMRERILMALQEASKGSMAASNHQQQTLHFARAALKKNESLKWQLLQQPNRLRIITIDSLCQSLTQAIPLPDKQTPYAKISENPKQHYMTAARACFNYALNDDNYHSPLKKLLQHVDNRQDHLLGLFSDLLMKRDQWLQLLFQAKKQDKKQYEHALAWILQHELDRFQASIPKEQARELMVLARRLASLDLNPMSLRAPLRDWHRFHELTPSLMHSLASLLLTSQNTLRKSFDHHVGLKKGVCPPDEYVELKSASKHLLMQLDALPDFLKALLRVKNLPSPSYDPDQWDVLQALFTLLPLLAGHLHLVFNEHNEVDFTSISQQALLALGEEDCPTDLALYLDNTIHHLLVDEFQDTSIQQYLLLSKLVQNIQPGEGKTLFVVGDPMQSIYRFRSAEVGLFLRAKYQGIGPIALIPLELTCNFRSTATVVDWVNQHFKSIFPHIDDIESGAISYHPSVNIKPMGEDSRVMAYEYDDRHQEAQAIVKCVLSELATYPNDEVAILVRSRNQLTQIMRELRKHKIPFQGVDIDHLAKLPHLRDVWSLTQALLLPGNRLAWLTMLRSPWCGLSLSDLLCIASFSKHKSIYFALSQLNEITGLSDEGRHRAQFFFSVMDHALFHRHQQSLTRWITTTLNTLHLNHILDAEQQNDLEQFWRLLDRFDLDGRIENFAEFRDEFNTLFSQRVVPSRLKIMTIHKSKGLEFDCVILPGLGTKSPNVDTPLLRWLQLPSQDHEERLLFSPMKSAYKDNCLLYDHIGKLDAEKNRYELQRLLYVAVTRAKKRLYLFDNSKKISQGTCRELLHLQPFLSEQESVTTDALMLPPSFHLPSAFYQRLPHHSQALNQTTSPRLVADNTPRLTGIVAHELLQWMGDHHPETVNEIPWELVSHPLRALGFDNTEQQSTLDKLKSQFTAFLQNPIGQWLIKPHEEEHNEYELLVNQEGTIHTKIIDRTFYEKGIRWIIDFKTGQDDTYAEQHHRQQLNEYARLFSHLRQESIRCGLYYLTSHHWITWEPVN